ncbi:MAG: hypothetical protein ACLGIY_08705, partial [Betaproteobacteria bacterium]
MTVWSADFAWKAFTFVVVAAGGTTAGVLASGLQIFAAFGWLAWFGVGLLSAAMTALILYLVRASQRSAAETALANALATKSTQVNPLQSSLSDAIIHLSDLYLPG